MLGLCEDVVIDVAAVKDSSEFLINLTYGAH